MRKSLIILSVFVALIACKKEEKTVGTNENGEKLILNEDGDTVVMNVDSTAYANSDSNQPTALVKNTDDSYSFRYNLKKGETYPFLLKTQQDQSMTAGGQSMSMSSERTVGFDYFVEDAVNNVFKLKATFKGFSEKFKAPTGETISYNTNAAKPTDKDV